ncbi:MAG: WYL domain-containing protein, partial [Acidobacteriota bacterium]|nr:WYL domain-containing protein [Acidobacteriota bacterium]
MAKDTEKLIRQLSLISYLMAERRPVTAPEIRRDVEGYSVMNEDAFARRFYADRSDLEALGIVLSVEKPQDGQVEQEQYSLPPENFHVPPIEFDDAELAALWTALHLLDGKFAYAEPLRLALQQISWGRPSPLDSPVQRTIALGITGAADGHEVSQRLAKIETAIFRRKTIVFEYYTMERDSLEQRRVDPYQLLFQGGQFYVVGHSHERDAVRVFRLSRIRGKVGYATKAEHDFQRPADFDPRAYADRIQWQFGAPIGNAEIWISGKIAWQIQRHFGRYGELRPAEDGSGSIFTTSYANTRQLIAWVLGLGENARVVGPAELVSELRERVHMLAARHSGDPDELPSTHDHELRGAPEESSAPAGAEDDTAATESDTLGADAVIRPERFARLVTLASILIDSGRSGRTLWAAELRDRVELLIERHSGEPQIAPVVDAGGRAELDGGGASGADGNGHHP